MKHARMLCLIGLAMTFLLSIAAGASATVVTSGGTSYTGSFTAEATDVYLHRHELVEYGLDVTCQKSVLEGQIESHGLTTTASIGITKLVFQNCNSTSFVTEMATLKAGALQLHTASGDSEGTSGNATATHSGLEITTKWVGTGISEHCNFKLTEGDIGALTGSKSTGATARLDVNAELTTNFSCGYIARLTGAYTITTPDNLNID